jgi:hypothetical protein
LQVIRHWIDIPLRTEPLVCCGTLYPSSESGPQDLLWRTLALQWACSCIKHHNTPAEFVLMFDFLSFRCSLRATPSGRCSLHILLQPPKRRWNQSAKKRTMKVWLETTRSGWCSGTERQGDGVELKVAHPKPKNEKK